MIKKIYILLILVFIYLICFGYFIYFIVPQKNDSISAQYDAVIVLTGAKHRINRGLDLLIEGKSKKLLITGVGSSANLEDIEYFNKDFPIKYIQNLKDRISLGHMATNTKENAIEARRWIYKNNIRSIILVTSNYHMPRSLYEFELAIPEIKIVQNSVFTNNLINKNFTRLYYLMFSEYNKFLIVKTENIINRILK